MESASQLPPSAAPETLRATRWWRRPSVLFALAVASLFVVLLTVATSRQGPPRAGDPAPAFDAALLSGGGSLGTADLRGKPFLLNFWASWCEPCDEEIPLLQRASERFEGQVEIVGVNIKDTTGDAIRFASAKDIGYPLVRDDGLEIYGDYGLTGQPESFFVDASGVIVEHIPGPMTEERLDQLLGVLVTRDG